MEKFNRALRGYDPEEVNAFLDQVITQVEKMIAEGKEKDKKIYELKDESQFTIYKEGKIFVVDGPAVQRVMRRVNVEDNESLHYFHKCLDDLGVNQALKKAGVQEGDTVRVVDWELEWYD